MAELALEILQVALELRTGQFHTQGNTIAQSIELAHAATCLKGTVFHVQIPQEPHCTEEDIIACNKEQRTKNIAKIYAHTTASNRAQNYEKQNPIVKNITRTVNSEMCRASVH